MHFAISVSNNSRNEDGDGFQATGVDEWYVKEKYIAGMHHINMFACNNFLFLTTYAVIESR
jgi:hypothetical protein